MEKSATNTLHRITARVGRSQAAPTDKYTVSPGVSLGRAAADWEGPVSLGVPITLPRKVGLHMESETLERSSFK